METEGEYLVRKAEQYAQEKRLMEQPPSTWEELRPRTFLVRRIKEGFRGVND